VPRAIPLSIVLHFQPRLQGDWKTHSQYCPFSFQSMVTFPTPITRGLKGDLETPLPFYLPGLHFQPRLQGDWKSNWGTSTIALTRKLHFQPRLQGDWKFFALPQYSKASLPLHFQPRLQGDWKVLIRH